jgi:hypothetical protein
MQLSQMWREHLKAGCPAEMRGLNIAGTAASALDAEITACVSACVTHSLKMDSRIERRLHDIAHALEVVSEHYPAADQDLLRECRILTLAIAATWRWDRNDQLPNGRQLGTEWLSQLRAALDR